VPVIIAFLDSETNLNPNPDLKPGKSSVVDGSGSRRAKITHENRRKLRLIF
jgi:hypothetical protein